MADKRVASIKLEQIEQYYGELSEKQETLSREEFLRSTTEQRAVNEDVFDGTSYELTVSHRGYEQEFGYGISCADRETRDVLYVEFYGEADIERERSRCG